VGLDVPSIAAGSSLYVPVVTAGLAPGEIPLGLASATIARIAGATGVVTRLNGTSAVVTRIEAEGSIERV
jgi:hypothetical protein